MFIAPAHFFSFLQNNIKVKPDQTLLLYPEGQHSDKGLEGAYGPLKANGITAEMEYMDDKGIIYKIGDGACIDLYFPENPNGQMVVICPGGAYWKICMGYEGSYVAEWLLERGISACVVKYRLPNFNFEIPLHDMQNVFRYCRANAEEWGISQIGVMGFSAGGHLAACVTNMFVDKATRPDFSILIYPVITMKKELTNPATRENLLGPDENWKGKEEELNELVEKYSMENQVKAETPVTFIAHCTDDKSVPVENTIRYCNALVANGVETEVHIYPEAGHGWGYNSEKYVGKGNDRFAYARAEFEASLERWLEDLVK